MRAPRASERGFTLVETMAAIGLFAIITLGTVPLMITAVRGVDLSRRSTVAKTLAQEAMERARGLPYFVSFASQNQQVDVLDLYYPNYQASGTYTTACTSATVSRACPKDIPAGYTVTFRATFVEGVLGADGKEDFSPVVAPTSYAWNSTSSGDHPVSDLLELSVAVSWSQTGRTRSFELKSIIGDRKFTDLKVSGRARVEHGVRILTQFSHPSYRTGVSALNAIDGSVDASIETKEFSTARLSLESANLRLDDVVPEGGGEGGSIGSGLGVSIEAAAPPTQTPANQTVGAIGVAHPGAGYPPGGIVVGADGSATEDLYVGVTGELPSARGTYYYAKDNGVRDIYAYADLDEVNAVALHLDYTKPMVHSRPWNNGNSNQAFRGTALAETTALTSGDRKVRTYASSATRYLSILPTTFIPPSTQGSFHAVMVVDSFTASVDCKATGSATATASFSWNASIRYYQDSNPGDDIPSGSYQTLTLTQTSNVASVMAGLGNPLVYDGLIPADDIYLFEDVASGKKGYFRSIVGGVATSGVLEGGKVATATVPSVIVIETTNLNPTLPDSSVSLSIGSLSCEAVDRR